MKKVILLLFFIILCLWGCTNTQTKLNLSNDSKRILLGSMHKADFDHFRFSGKFKFIVNSEKKVHYDIKLDSYNDINHYSYNNLLINDKKVNAFIQERNLYLAYDQKYEYIDLDKLKIDKYLLDLTCFPELLNTFSFDSKEALDVLTVYSTFLGYKFQYHFTSNHFPSIAFDEKSDLYITLNYSRNVLESIDVDAVLIYQEGETSVIIDGVFKIYIQESNIELPDISKYHQVDFLTFASNNT